MFVVQRRSSPSYYAFELHIVQWMLLLLLAFVLSFGEGHVDWFGVGDWMYVYFLLIRVLLVEHFEVEEIS